MDTTKIIKAIQIIVKEEIKKEMVKQKKAIRESILKEIKSASAKSQPTQVEKDPLDIDHIFEQTKLPKKQVFKSTGFADLLNETADRGEWRSINGNGGSFGTNAAAAWGGSVGQQPNTLQSIDGKSLPIEQLQQTAAGTAVVNALTRDYSSLMKTINVKKGK